MSLDGFPFSESRSRKLTHYQTLSAYYVPGKWHFGLQETSISEYADTPAITKECEIAQEVRMSFGDLS